MNQAKVHNPRQTFTKLTNCRLCNHVFTFLGTDADATSRINDTQNLQRSQPTINKLYQMLHTGTDLHNHTLLNFNHTSINLNSYFYNNLYSSQDKIHCCQTSDGKTTGANIVVKNESSIDKDVRKNRKRRIVNIVKVERNDTRTVEMTTRVPEKPVPVVMERKRKPGETGSSAPLLNYIFDTYSNTHQHRNDR